MQCPGSLILVVTCTHSNIFIDLQKCFTKSHSFNVFPSKIIKKSTSSSLDPRYEWRWLSSCSPPLWPTWSSRCLEGHRAIPHWADRYQFAHTIPCASMAALLPPGPVLQCGFKTCSEVKRWESTVLGCQKKKKRKKRGPTTPSLPQKGGC